jgi:hypothetical protein
MTAAEKQRRYRERKFRNKGAVVICEGCGKAFKPSLAELLADISERDKFTAECLREIEAYMRDAIVFERRIAGLEGERGKLRAEVAANKTRIAGLEGELARERQEHEATRAKLGNTSAVTKSPPTNRERAKRAAATRDATP